MNLSIDNKLIRFIIIGDEMIINHGIFAGYDKMIGIVIRYIIKW